MDTLDSYLSTKERDRRDHIAEQDAREQTALANFTAAQAMAAEYGVEDFDTHCKRKVEIWDDKDVPQWQRTAGLLRFSFVAKVVGAVVGRLRAEVMAGKPGARLNAVDALVRLGLTTPEAWATVWAATPIEQSGTGMQPFFDKLKV